MKKLLLTSLMIMLMLCMISNVSMALTAKVNANGVRVRKEASTSSSIVTSLDKDAEVQLLDQEGDWYKIKYNDYTGYIRKDLLTSDDNFFAKNNDENNNNINNSTAVQNTNDKTTSEPTNNNTTNTSVSSEIDVHVIPTIFSTVEDTIKKNQEVQIIKELNHWLYVKYDEKTGWIIKEKLNSTVQISEAIGEDKNIEIEENENEKTENIEKTDLSEKKEENTQENDQTQKTTYEEKTAYVSSQSGVNLRKDSSTSSSVLDTLLVNTEIKIIGEDGDWYKVKYNSQEGYIMKKYISDTKVEVTTTDTTTNTVSSRNADATRKVEVTEETSAEGKRIAEFALQFVGYPYVYGGTNPYTGADCTGFAYYVYNQCGYPLSRSCSVQAKSGVEVAKEDIQPGDLIIFNDTSNTSIGHVGIYVGDGLFVHASNPERGILTDRLDSGSYPKRYVCTRRIV